MEMERKKKRKEVVGWYPPCLFLDIDLDELDLDLSGVDNEGLVRNEVRRLQKKFELGDADVYRSSEDSYHIYFFMDQSIPREKEVEIICFSPLVDPEFKQFQMERDRTRARISEKSGSRIEHLFTVESRYEGHFNSRITAEQVAENTKRQLKQLT